MYSQYNIFLLYLIIAILLYIIAIWEIYILFNYQDNEVSAYYYTIIKSISNFIFGFYIFYKKSNKFLNYLIIILIIVTDIWLLILICNKDHYEFFKKVIIIEFIILYIQSVGLIIFLLQYSYKTKPTNDLVIMDNNIPTIIIDIPSATLNNLEIFNNESLPQAVKL
jgi:hypothetical protein